MAQLKIKATTTKKAVGEHSEAHERWLLRWERFVRKNGIDHVWAVSPRDPGRSPGRVYLAVKLGAKSYSIVEANEATLEMGAPLAVAESPKAIMALFADYRAKAKAERSAS